MDFLNPPIINIKYFSEVVSTLIWNPGVEKYWIGYTSYTTDESHCNNLPSFGKLDDLVKYEVEGKVYKYIRRKVNNNIFHNIFSL